MIPEIARSWIGTPYRDQQAVKGHGCDCLGLLRGIYEEVTGLSAPKPPPYTRSWGEAQGEEKMLEAGINYLVPTETVEVGSIIVFRMKPGCVAKHCGIVIAKDIMVHAHVVKGVEEVHLVDYWVKRIAGVFNFPEVSKDV